MVLITDGFSDTGMALINKLNKENFNNLIISANETEKSKSPAYKIESTIKSLDVINWLSHNADEVDFVFDISTKLETSKQIWKVCATNQVPIIFIDAEKNFLKWARQQKEAPFFWQAISKIDDRNLEEAIDEIFRLMIERNFGEDY